MEKFVVTGGKKLHGTISVSGAKNVALKALVAACLTEEEVIIENVPL
ncbi:MAG: UDP-N-acetylglucosamine 1-carboxyvinyltransferase, partial [Patescibacteria group bacterium]|nr:UDP-N-acetylglucosamine 1-carboxyvinyltransferase [Patescibacteria group bacterium]